MHGATRARNSLVAAFDKHGGAVERFGVFGCIVILSQVLLLGARAPASSSEHVLLVRCKWRGAAPHHHPGMACGLVFVCVVLSLRMHLAYVSERVLVGKKCSLHGLMGGVLLGLPDCVCDRLGNMSCSVAYIQPFANLL